MINCLGKVLIVKFAVMFGVFIFLSACFDNQDRTPERQDRQQEQRDEGGYFTKGLTWDENYMRKGQARTYASWLRGKGYMDQFSLEAITSYLGVKGEISGSSFLFSGPDFSGSIETKYKVLFAWRKTGHIYFSTIPISGLVIAPSITSPPTVEITWRMISEIREVINNNDLTRLANGRFIHSATIRIGQSDLEKDIYLKIMK